MKKNDISCCRKWQWRKFLLMMKFVWIFIIIGLISANATESYSQVTRFDLSMKNATLKSILSKIEEKTEFYFFYKNEEIEPLTDLSIKVSNASIFEVLDYLLKDKDFEYEVYDRYILILENKNSQFSEKLIQQGRTISGKVTDSSGAPLPGVTVLAKGTTQGTITNSNGEYSLTNISEDGVLVFSFVGMRTQEVAVANRTTLNVTLEEEVIGIEEVVAVGYGTVKRTELTGAVSSISSESFLDQPASSSISVLAGRAPGVSVRRSNAAPGSGPMIRIRGANSLLGSNSPLIVVDGNYEGLPDMYDIESIEVLKDASATAIYGSRGANGVILVTTKRGKERKPTLQFHSDVSFERIPHFYDLMDAGEFAEFNSSVGAYPYTAEEIAYFKKHGGTDWQNEIMQTGLSQNYKAVLSGGSKTVRYYITPSYSKTTGIIRNTEAGGYGLKAKVDMDVSDRLTIQVESSVSHSSNLNPGLATGGSKTSIPLMAAIAFAPTEPVYDEDGSYNNLGAGTGAMMNPVLMTEDNETNYGNGGNAVGNLEFKILEGLTLNAKGRMGYGTGGSRNFETKDFDGVNANASQSSYESKSWLVNSFLTYNKTFASRHNFTAMLGFEESKSESRSHSGSANVLPIEAMGWDNLGLASPNIGVGSGYSNDAMRSYFGRVNYNYASRYYLTMNYRADGSSKFRDDNKWGYFPSFSLAWRLSEEEFMKNQDLFKNIMLRGGYGVTGSQAVSSYATYSPLRGASFVWGGTRYTGYMDQVGGNPDLKWESTKQMNIGADFIVLNDRILVNLDYYNKKTVDLLAPLTVPTYGGGTSEYGRSSVTTNVGSVKNEGIEAKIDYRVFANSDWSYHIDLNGAYNWNEVLDLGENEFIWGSTYAAGLTSTSPFVLMKGSPIGTIYGIKYLGIWQENQAAEAAKFGALPGDYRYEDLNGDYSYGSEDRQVIGNMNAPFTWGFNNRLSYKNFDLNLLFEGVVGRDIMNWSYLVATERIDFTQLYTHRDAKDRWTPSNTDAEFARIGNSHLIPISSQWVQDGSYVKLRNLSLAYSIPKSVLSFASVRLSVSAQNLLTITDYKGYDPEISSTGNDANAGMDWFAYPNAKSLSFGISFEY